jgi:hypothetical protein
VVSSQWLRCTLFVNRDSDASSLRRLPMARRGHQPSKTTTHVTVAVAAGRAVAAPVGSAVTHACTFSPYTDDAGFSSASPIRFHFDTGGSQDSCGVRVDRARDGKRISYSIQQNLDDLYACLTCLIDCPVRFFLTFVFLV